MLLHEFGQQVIVQHEVEAEENHRLDRHAQQVAADVVPIQQPTLISDS